MNSLFSENQASKVLVCLFVAKVKPEATFFVPYLTVELADDI